MQHDGIIMRKTPGPNLGTPEIWMCGYRVITWEEWSRDDGPENHHSERMLL
jgi:hypothetical protein